VSMERTSESRRLVCPLCGGPVDATGCARCHLSATDILKHASTPSKSSGRALWSRFIGLVVYAGIAVWSWYFMPTVFLFVLPGALVGAYFQSLRGRPVVGAMVCFIILVVVPVFMWSAGLTGLFANITGGR
jgi:hypothetical protein